MIYVEKYEVCEIIKLKGVVNNGNFQHTTIWDKNTGFNKDLNLKELDFNL